MDCLDNGVQRLGLFLESPTVAERPEYPDVLYELQLVADYQVQRRQNGQYSAVSLPRVALVLLLGLLVELGGVLPAGLLHVRQHAGSLAG